ncbi:NADH dehydrogenase [ubiquinone] 1 beta subcomplex subunit 7 [Cardamine amara subsp. amara]|uniref:NADH dehydrogenase [ubiquinone] 1 beta subcomplex subunit 7 n=1 Tax=Cardamine amara subsp. amara TaxID=228776 RepID=A0ABD1BZR7_CARAN
MEVPGSSKKMIATQEEMAAAKIALGSRDQCAHLLIPLNKCRQAEFYLPWKCEDERHVYEKCEYELVMERMLAMKKIREEEALAKQNKLQGNGILWNCEEGGALPFQYFLLASDEKFVATFSDVYVQDYLLFFCLFSC